MTASNSHGHNSPERGQKFHKTILNDLRRSDFKRTLGQDFRDIYYFYLDKESRSKLAAMGRVRRWFTIVLWLLKNMILKLAPVRRLLLVASIIGFLIGRNEQNSALSFFAFLVLFLILMFELRDKLLARDELETGRAVQSALIPRTSPELPGWEVWMYTRPANEVGGDLIDYLELPDGRLGLVLGDVVGKGLGAALLMAKLQATLRAIAPGFSSLSELCARMNEIFVRDGLPSHFASMVYLELVPDSGKVRFINAGHFPPIRGRGKEIDEMQQGGAALGIVSDEIYTEQFVELEKGEWFLVYSDGVTEALNERGEFYGEERLKHVLRKAVSSSAAEVGLHLLHDVDGFIGKARSSDDLSLILIRRAV